MEYRSDFYQAIAQQVAKDFTLTEIIPIENKKERSDYFSKWLSTELGKTSALQKFLDGVSLYEKILNLDEEPYSYNFEDIYLEFCNLFIRSTPLTKTSPLFLFYSNNFIKTTPTIGWTLQETMKKRSRILLYLLEKGFLRIFQFHLQKHCPELLENSALGFAFDKIKVDKKAHFYFNNFAFYPTPFQKNLILSEQKEYLGGDEELFFMELLNWLEVLPPSLFQENIYQLSFLFPNLLSVALTAKTEKWQKVKLHFFTAIEKIETILTNEENLSLADIKQRILTICHEESLYETKKAILHFAKDHDFFLSEFSTEANALFVLTEALYVIDAKGRFFYSTFSETAYFNLIKDSDLINQHGRINKSSTDILSLLLHFYFSLNLSARKQTFSIKNNESADIFLADFYPFIKYQRHQFFKQMIFCGEWSFSKTLRLLTWLALHIQQFPLTKANEKYRLVMKTLIETLLSIASIRRVIVSLFFLDFEKNHYITAPIHMSKVARSTSSLEVNDRVLFLQKISQMLDLSSEQAFLFHLEQLSSFGYSSVESLLILLFTLSLEEKKQSKFTLSIVEKLNKQESIFTLFQEQQAQQKILALEKEIKQIYCCFTL